MTSFEQHILVPFRQILEQYADRNAFFIGGTYYTYRQFSERVSSIRDVIHNIEGDERILGVALHDDIDTYASIFAIWMEGKSYVPLHPYWPEDRRQSIKEQIGCRYVLDRCGSSCDGGKIFPWMKTSDDELAYILFTSGSTGVPKGVCITRGNVAAFVESFWKTGINITSGDRCMQCFDLSFDVSVQGFLVALTKGACVYTVPYGQVKYLSVASLIQEHGITFGAMAPSMLAYLRPYFDELDASSLKTCILTAEACPVDLMEDWFKCAVNADLYDFYGPTEATVYCTYYKLNRNGENLSVNGVISIGKPLANVQAFILDESGNVLSVGQKGELCVAGEQVTSGYWRFPEKNKESFFTKEIDGVSYRLYHTGDLCYWDKTGNIMYLGRIDQQAKIQGFRVELSEIEYHARAFYHKQKRVLAIAFNGKEGLTEIALFVESSLQDSEDLLKYLRSKMPGYMIPSIIRYKPVFPLNSSDKIDRNKLKQELS